MILMNKYSSAIGKIKVRPQMEEKILKSVLSKKETKVEIKKQYYLKWIKPVSIIAGCCIIIFGFMLTYSSFINSDKIDKGEKKILISNPIINVESIEELKKAVPFELVIPNKLPNEYKVNHISIISGELVEIVYSDGSNKITYRTAKGKDDVSGDYTSYEESDDIKIDDMEVKVKGSKSLINLATWQSVNYSYSLNFSAGAEKNILVSIIGSMKKQ